MPNLLIPCVDLREESKDLSLENCRKCLHLSAATASRLTGAEEMSMIGMSMIAGAAPCLHQQQSKARVSESRVLVPRSFTSAAQRTSTQCFSVINGVSRTISRSKGHFNTVTFVAYVIDKHFHLGDLDLAERGGKKLSIRFFFLIVF